MGGHYVICEVCGPVLKQSLKWNGSICNLAAAVDKGMTSRIWCFLKLLSTTSSSDRDVPFGVCRQMSLFKGACHSCVCSICSVCPRLFWLTVTGN